MQQNVVYYYCCCGGGLSLYIFYLFPNLFHSFVSFNYLQFAFLSHSRRNYQWSLSFFCRLSTIRFMFKISSKTRVPLVRFIPSRRFMSSSVGHSCITLESIEHDCDWAKWHALNFQKIKRNQFEDKQWVQPSCDHRTYRYLVLQNGMKVLLIYGVLMCIAFSCCILHSE